MTASTIFFIAGPNGAGKTTLTTTLQQPGHLLAGIRLLNPDVIAQSLDPSTTNVEIAAARQTIEEFRRHLEQRETFAVETTFSGRRHLIEIRDAHQAGFQVHLIYVGVNRPTLSVLRIQTRVAAGGHHVPTDAVLRRYERSMKNLARALPLVDTASIYDNSGRRHVRVAEIKVGHVVALFTDPPQWLTHALGQTINVGDVIS